MDGGNTLSGEQAVKGKKRKQTDGSSSQGGERVRMQNDRSEEERRRRRMCTCLTNIGQELIVHLSTFLLEPSAPVPEYRQQAVKGTVSRNTHTQTHTPDVTLRAAFGNITCNLPLLLLSGLGAWGGSGRYDIWVITIRGCHASVSGIQATSRLLPEAQLSSQGSSSLHQVTQLPLQRPS